jgi:hypothetical protein
LGACYAHVLNMVSFRIGQSSIRSSCDIWKNATMSIDFSNRLYSRTNNFVFHNMHMFCFEL